jgi:hypothetical protein
MTLPSPSVLQASAARFLIDGAEGDAANVLLACELDLWASGDTWYAGDEALLAVHVSLAGPRAAHEILNNDSHPVSQAIRRAIEAVFPAGLYIRHYTVHAQLIEIDPDWRTELLEIARGKGIHNQTRQNMQGLIWKNLGFRSKSEVCIAQALDRVGVLYLPNCLARLDAPDRRKNREADFLVCADGKWGILEVDGEPFHPPSRTVQDHERDRLFRLHGVRVVEHFDASECFNHPDQVVAKFLELLWKS